MSEVFQTKIRRVGTSLGILIPKKVISQEHLRAGSVIDVGLLKRQRVSLIRKYFGIAKGAGAFEREYEEDRV